MSVRVMGCVWDSALPHNLKFVLLSYADHADHDGANIWPAIATTARKTGYSDRAVQQCTRQLQRLAILVPDGQAANNVRKWRIDLDALAAYPGGEKSSPPENPGGEIHDTQGVKSTTSGGEESAPDPTTDPSIEEPSIGGGGVVTLSDPDLSDSKKNARPPARDPRPAPLPDYTAANHDHAAISHALQAVAGLLDPATRAGILEANPAITVEAVFAWDSYRTRINSTAPNTRQMGAGALVALLRTAAKPPSSTTDPANVERWLIAHDYLAAPETTLYSSTSDPTADLEPCDPDALARWQDLRQEYALDPAIDRILAQAIPVALDDASLTIRPANQAAYEILHHRLTHRLTRTLTARAGRPLTLTLLPP